MPRFLSPDQKISDYSTWKLITDAYLYIHPYGWSFFVGSFMKFLTEVLGLYPVYAFASLVTIISEGNLANSAPRIWMIAYLWIGSNVLGSIFQYIGRVKIFNISEKVAIDMERKAINHMFNIDISWHEKENTGNKLKRINNASSGFSRLLKIWVNVVIPMFVSFTGILVILYQFSTSITLMTMVFLVVYYLVTKQLLKRAGFASHEVNVASEEVSGLQFEAVNNIRSVKIMSMISTLADRLDFSFGKLYEKTQKKIFWLMNRNSGGDFLGFVFKAVIIIFILHGIINGQLELGLLVLFNNYFNRVWDSVQSLTNVSEDLLVSRYAISRLNQILNEPVSIDKEDDKDLFPTGWHTIELKNVSFAYGDNEVLKSISFKINRGERIGVVGLSGAGKSTLFKLLLKEYENFIGEILVDSIPIQKISKQDYFKHVAVVLQETEVFNFSLRENIYLANPGAQNKDSELNRALEIAHVNDFLSKLPEGVDTKIGEKGVRLSGGEKQRLGIARAVYKNPQLLLLDEATSHLDLESEEKIQDSLHKFFDNVTAVVIAHRLTTIKEMDKIIVIEDGEIIESGNFAELTAKQGRFYELWEKQRL